MPCFYQMVPFGEVMATQNIHFWWLEILRPESSFPAQYKNSWCWMSSLKEAYRRMYWSFWFNSLKWHFEHSVCIQYSQNYFSLLNFLSCLNKPQANRYHIKYEKHQKMWTQNDIGGKWRTPTFLNSQSMVRPLSKLIIKVIVIWSTMNLPSDEHCHEWVHDRNKHLFVDRAKSCHRNTFCPGL